MKNAFLILILGTAIAQAQTPNFKAQQIDGEIGIGYGLAVADVNGDRRTDILLADSHVIVWYENPTWEKHVIAENLTEKDHVCIAARDIDGDGKCEIAVGAEWNPGDTTGSGAVFYLLPPADRTKKWEPVKLTHEPTTHRMKWVRNRAGRYDLVVVPLHGRGNDKNAEGAGVRVLAYHMPDDPHKEWNTTLVQASMHKTRHTISTSFLHLERRLRVCCSVAVRAWCAWIRPTMAGRSNGSRSTRRTIQSCKARGRCVTARLRAVSRMW